NRQERQKWDDELSDAARIQKRLLPSRLPQPAGYQIAGISHSARFVGGDYFDVVETSGQVSLCIADVAGKGLPAALLMANLQAALKPQMLQGADPVEICTVLNRAMAHAAQSEKFISSFHGLLDLNTRRLIYCNAGHLPPLVVRADGSH